MITRLEQKYITIQHKLEQYKESKAKIMKIITTIIKT